jgi:hypothetical protein
MNARLKKEIRPLLLPGVSAAAAALLFPILQEVTRPRFLNRGFLGGVPVEWLTGLVCLLLFTGCMAMAAMSFGVDLQHRTLGLMLVQPAARFQLWLGKMLPLAGGFAAVGLAYGVGVWLACSLADPAVPAVGFVTRAMPGDVIVAMACLLGILCSGGFWTLVSRSIIGGMVLPLAAQAFLAAVIGYFVTDRTMVVDEEQQAGLFLALGIGAVLYCLLFACLGWRKFACLEWREGSAGASAVVLRWVRPRDGVVPSRPSSGPDHSLFRKELRLQKPVFLLGLLFACCWFAALGLRPLRPAWRDEFEAILVVMLAVYLPLAWLLPGCICLGEEKVLGTWGWHLTLPISAVRQWAFKLAVALLVVLGLGIALPGFAWLAAQGFKIEGWLSGWPFLLVAGGATLLSFWSVTMLGTTIRAVLFSILGSGVLLFGGVLIHQLGFETCLQRAFGIWIMVQLQLSPDAVYFSEIELMGSVIGFVLLSAVLLRQGYAHCRREPSRGVIIRSSLVLLASLFLPVWWSADFTNSIRSHSALVLTHHLRSSIMETPIARQVSAMGGAAAVSLGELDRTGMLDAPTRRWLRGANIMISGSAPAGSHQRNSLLLARVTFPNGNVFQVQCPLSGIR